MSNAEFDYLGPYHIQRVLGRGGMGSVYQGMHSQSGKVVAVKVLATGIANQSRFRRRFAAEIEALQRLKHPNIVELYGYGEEAGMLFYSMEFVDGRSLHEILRERGQMNWQEVIEIAIATTSALQHAHNIGIIHRDLKPANLMLSVEGELKLTDFGISKLFGSSDETATGAVIGTADFMPPEQAEGKPVNVRSDLYSLGCVMYALLAGKAPFAGKTVPEVLYSVRYNPVPNLATRAPGAPKELVAMIHQLLEKDPQKRPPTALVVGNRLKALQQGLRRQSETSAETREHAADSSTRESVGKQLTSLDMSEIEAEIELTGIEDDELSLLADSGETQRGSEGMGTREQQTMLAPGNVSSSKVNEDQADVDSEPAMDSASQLHDVDSRDSAATGSLAADGRSHSWQAHGSRSAEELQDSQDPLGSLGSLSSAGTTTGGRKSHYTPVTRDGRGSRPFEREEPQVESGADWLHIGSIVGIVGLLLASVAFGWWMLQPRSADELMVAIQTAVDSGDDGQFLLAGAEMDEFLRRFPEDERHGQVQSLADEAELVQRMKLLQRKATRSGGLEELSAIEQAFLDCLRARSENASLAKQKLEAFVAVFGRLENLDRGDQRLVELAEFASKISQAVVIGNEPMARVQLDAMVVKAEADLQPPALNAYYRKLLLLYGDKPWAREQMTRIKNKLAAELRVE